MNKKHVLLILVVILSSLVLTGCSSKNNEYEKQVMNLKAEIEQLKKENEEMKNSEENLYKQAITEMDSRNYELAIEKFEHLKELYPQSQLAVKAENGINECKKKILEREEAKNPPVVVVSTRVEPADFIYASGYVTYQSKSKKPIDKIDFKILMFDKEGYPVNDDYSKTNDMNGQTDDNLHPGRTATSGWMIDGDAYKIKAKVSKVYFFDDTTWEDPEINIWLEKEKSKY